ncbi:hypothetical protein [Halocalculus aciditolerans]|uniref:Uncharacterized protein n=1 Tax=Halocalculus aciditolerans TaxID=1383812 RepID=A0A830FF38_9EURY|nr:hypothetical protein [Halocalculus aciditolerans]GGL69307.1 hypothetical protein GCM10009039_29100 [Halocalculus aciditolerans]
MERKRIGVVAVAVIVVVAAGAYAVFMGVGPVPGGGGDGNVSGYPTASDGNTYNGTDDGGMAGGPPFTFSVDEITQCGQTCRNVTVTLNNEQSTAAKNVTVYSRIYAGNNTNPDNRVWSGRQQVGQIAANSSYTDTQTVKLSYSEGYAVQQHDGWITILTTVKSEGETVTFKMQRDAT